MGKSMGSLHRKNPNMWDLHHPQAGGSGAARAALWSQRDGAEAQRTPLTLSSHLQLQISTSGRSRPQGTPGTLWGAPLGPHLVQSVEKNPKEVVQKPP